MQKNLENTVILIKVRKMLEKYYEKETILLEDGTRAILTVIPKNPISLLLKVIDDLPNEPNSNGSETR